jgi:hypothetical protein
VALSEVFWQLLLILHASPTPRPVEMLLLLLLGLWRLSQELQALHPGLDLVLKYLLLLLPSLQMKELLLPKL